jgi:hypothetical protein
MRKIRKKTIILVGLFCFLFLFIRLPKINTDEINPDGVNWHYRMQQFIVGLKTGQLEKTYQHYHPGVTLMWIAGVPVEIYKQITNVTVYDMNNFEDFHLVAKVSVIFAQLILSLLAMFLLSKILGFDKSFLVILLLSLEPFFLGNSRLFHMDVLFALFTFDALLFSYIALQNENKTAALFAGIFLALSFLTKSIGIGAFLFVIFYSLKLILVDRKSNFAKSYFPILLGSFLISLFLFFPALFKGPIYYISEIFKESERIGVRNSHGQIIFGEYTEDLGPEFYPLVIIMKVSPFVLLGITFAIICLLLNFKKIFQNKRQYVQNFPTYLVFFYLAYLLVMTFPSKKIDRYLIPMYPLFSYIAVMGFSEVLDKFKKYKRHVVFSIVSAFAVFVILPDINLFPYYFTYTSLLFGTPEKANSVIAQKPFGIGIFEVRDAIINKYGDHPRLGFIDVKPIEAIYPNSKVFDVRVTGPGSYEYIVLGVNEVMPEKISQDTRFNFEKDISIYINGLEYWRIYAKKTK